MEPIESSETSAYNNTLTPGTYPKEKKLQSKHGESLKSRNINTISPFSQGSIPALCPTQPATHCAPGPSTQEKRSDRQPDHLAQLVPKFRMSGVTPSLLTYAFMPCTETALYLPVHLSKKKSYHTTLIFSSQ